MGADVQSATTAWAAWDALEHDERLAELGSPLRKHEETFDRDFERFPLSYFRILTIP